MELTIIDGLFVIVGTLGGCILKILWSAIKEEAKSRKETDLLLFKKIDKLEDSDQEIREKILTQLNEITKQNAEFRVELARDYVRKVDLP